MKIFRLCAVHIFFGVNAVGCHQSGVTSTQQTDARRPEVTADNTTHISTRLQVGGSTWTDDSIPGFGLTAPEGSLAVAMG